MLLGPFAILALWPAVCSPISGGGEAEGWEEAKILS